MYGRRAFLRVKTIPKTPKNKEYSFAVVYTCHFRIFVFFSCSQIKCTNTVKVTALLMEEDLGSPSVHYSRHEGIPE
jgi:hypothetical protein